MSLKLDRADLLISGHCLIGGKWQAAASGAQFAVHNPANGKKLAQVPDCGEKETQAAISSAKSAFGPWSGLLAKERAQILRRWFVSIMDHQEDLARLMTAEQGKPLAEARGEIAYAASFIEFYAEEARRAYGDLIPAHGHDKRIAVLKQPIGVIAAITPWNFPAAMITRKVGPALAAGCTAVVKPAEATPLSALALGFLAQEAGIPAGVLNIVTGDAATIGEVLTSSPEVAKLSFTGSTEIGKLLYKQCADTVKKLSLELGGNAPFIVFADADLDAAVEGAIASKYRNSGQTCVCANRFLVQDKIYDAFADKLTQKTSQLRVGDGLTSEVDQGPLIDEAAVEKVESLLGDAIKKGAQIMTGGQRHALGRTFFEPTVIRDATPQMRLAQEEIFGPIAALYRFSTDEDAIALANDSRYGLAAYFYTRDLARSWHVGEALEYGIVGLNTGIISTEAAPFGGVKESGLGREGSRYGLDEFLEIKYFCIAGL